MLCLQICILTLLQRTLGKLNTQYFEINRTRKKDKIGDLLTFLRNVKCSL